jgi:site-specific recombinase XerD
VLLEAISESRRLRPETRQLYKSAVGLFIAFCGNERVALAANANVVEKWRDTMAAAGLGPETIGIRIHALRFAAKRLSDRGLNDNLLRAARATELLPATRSKIACPLTLDNVRRLIASCDSNRPVDVRDAAILTLALRTGLRRGGIAAIELADLAGSKLVVILKGGKKHELPPLDAETVTALDAWRRVLIAHGIKTGKLFRSIRAKPDLKGNVVIGAGMTGKTVYRIVVQRSAKLGLKIRAHDTRHFFVSIARAIGWPDHVIAAWTGHASVDGQRPQYAMLGTYTTVMGVEGLPALPSFR